MVKGKAEAIIEKDILVQVFDEDVFDAVIAAVRVQLGDEAKVNNWSTTYTKLTPSGDLIICAEWEAKE